ncbi:MAG TPA: PilZ domain-containing protein [Burkholderiaceae bacterium]|nr:PilZ domain-containing protein [Burkholderiaceae bacterium]
MPVELDGVKGLTRNISATGVYFETDAALTAPGSHVSLTIEVTMGGEKLQLVCEGEVVRIDTKRDGTLGIAARLRNSFFSNAEEYTDLSALDTVPASLTN